MCVNSAIFINIGSHPSRSLKIIIKRWGKYDLIFVYFSFLFSFFCIIIKNLRIYIFPTFFSVCDVADFFIYNIFLVIFKSNIQIVILFVLLGFCGKQFLMKIQKKNENIMKLYSKFSFSNESMI